MSFRDLQYSDEPLLLPNAWDVSSALAFYDDDPDLVAGFVSGPCESRPSSQSSYVSGGDA